MAFEPHDVLFEFRSIGSAVRVAAIDPASGIEIVILGPSSATRADLQRLAIAKLKKRLETSDFR